MNSVYVDSTANDAERRRRLYAGRLFVFTPRRSTLALVEHARGMIGEAFGSIPPQEAQHHLPVERLAEICAPLEPRFIHHPETKKLVADVVRGLGCDDRRTYLDVPRLRIVTSDGHLTSGIGDAHHPHRDTWYAAPMAQLNWWLPIYDIESESSIAFHPRYWSEPVRNCSARPEQELEPEPEIRLIVPAGGIVLYSAAHLHSTVPNTSGRARYSVDFRTVHLDDVEPGGGAPNLDSEPKATRLRDFVRASDLERMPEAIAAQHDDPAPAVDPESLVFRPS